MSYVPPHLRASGASAVAAPAAAAAATAFSAASTLDAHSRASRGCFGPKSAAPSRILPVSDAVFSQWSPSERVLSLTPLQVEEVRERLNLDVIVAPGSSPAPAPIESFQDMCLNSSIMEDITFHGYSAPTAVQAQAMPIALSGRNLLGIAETGSGKTAAFVIPMIQHCLAQPPVRRGDGPLALVLAPTRELAQQIEKEVKAFSRSLPTFKTAVVVGGTSMSDQRSELRAGADVVVATPGRFIDHLQQGTTSLSRTAFIVLDEADRMLDMGFELQMREVMRNLPQKHQTLLFSATMPVEIETLAQEYLADPIQVKAGKVSSPAANVCQVLEKVSDTGKIDQLLNMLVAEASEAEAGGRDFPRTVVFVDRKNRCDEVAEALSEQGLPAVALHGGRSQSEREAALNNFRNGSTSIMVATDVASRGLDVTGVAHVVNLDLPKTMEDYVHRIGRTGRAGMTGRATSLYTDRDMFLVSRIKKAIAEAEAGNVMTFATGKEARRKEREAANEANLAFSKLAVTGPTPMNMEDRYRYMVSPMNVTKKEGAADDAWDD